MAMIALRPSLSSPILPSHKFLETTVANAPLKALQNTKKWPLISVTHVRKTSLAANDFVNELDASLPTFTCEDKLPAVLTRYNPAQQAMREAKRRLRERSRNAAKAARRQKKLEQEKPLRRSSSEPNLNAFKARTLERVNARQQQVAADAADKIRQALRPWEQLAMIHPYCVAGSKIPPNVIEHFTTSRQAYKASISSTVAHLADSKETMADFDGVMSTAGVSVVALGDCHASRAVSLLTSFQRGHFFGGSIYSWIAGKRELPSLHSLCSPAIAHGRFLVFVISYGAIDCRCHSNKWFGKPELLSEPYVAKVLSYIADFNTSLPNVHVLPIILAVPPTTEPPPDQNDIQDAPFRDTLALRIEATDLLNTSLESVCSKLNVAFTGADTWDFAKDTKGALRLNISDGHGHVLINQCRTLHERIRRIIRDMIG